MQRPTLVMPAETPPRAGRAAQAGRLAQAAVLSVATAEALALAAWVVGEVKVAKVA